MIFTKAFKDHSGTSPFASGKFGVHGLRPQAKRREKYGRRIKKAGREIFLAARFISANISISFQFAAASLLIARIRLFRYGFSGSLAFAWAKTISASWYRLASPKACIQ